MNKVRVSAEVNIVDVAGNFVDGNDIVFLLSAAQLGLSKVARQDEFYRYTQAKITFLLKQAEKFKWKEEKK